MRAGSSPQGTVSFPQGNGAAAESAASAGNPAGRPGTSGCPGSSGCPGTGGCPVTVRECSEEYLLYLASVRGLSANTVTGYRTDLGHLALTVGADTALASLSTEDLRSCVAALSRRKYSVTSINRFIAAVRGLFAYCRKFQYIQGNAALELKTLRAPRRLPVFMTQQEVDTLCSQPVRRGLLWPARDRAIFELLYSSGCREGELASLRLQDSADGWQSAVVTGKGRKDRRIYFSDDARRALSVYLEERGRRFPEGMPGGGSPVDALFVNQKGLPLSAHGIWYIVSRYSGAEGTQRPVSPHAFRHTFATALLSGGADIRAVQELLGHSSISTTQRYTHITTERLKEVYRQAFPHSGKKD